MSSSVSSNSEAKVIASVALPTLAGKVAIITGSSRGIGRGIALSLARDGAKIVVNYNSDKKSADAVVAAITSVPGGSAIAIQADASKSADIDRLFAEAKKAFGRIDIVVANSGVSAHHTIATTPNDEFDRVYDVNVKGVFYTFRAAANNIENNGRIIVIGSSAKVGVIPALGPYSSTKIAVEVLAKTLAQELGSRGVTVNAVHPGAVETDLAQAMLNDPATRTAFENMTPQKRIGRIDDIGDAVALLVSDGARWISGQSICCDGAAKL